MNVTCTNRMQYDVVVVGSGPAGFGAAVAAGRNGLKTCLLEKGNKIGGVLAVCPFMPIAGAYIGKDSKKVGGIVEELAQNLIRQSPPAGVVRDNLLPVFGAELHYDHEALIMEMYRMLKEAGVDVYTEMQVYDAVAEADTVKEVVALGRSEFTAFEGKVFIDCSGDGVVAQKAGVPFEKGDDEGKMMGVTTTFMMEGLDWEKVFPPDMEDAFRSATVKEAIAAGKISPKIMYGYVLKGLHEGSGLFNCVTQAGIDGTDQEQIRYANETTRAWAKEMAEYFIENVEGFEKGRITYMGPQVGVRETRRCQGVYCLTVDDILSHARFEDGIACCGNPMDEVCRDEKGVKHSSVGGQEGTYYHVPFRCLIPQKMSNLMFAGRNLSCESRTLASVRAMATCMLMGQACGNAAKAAVENKIPVQQVDTAWLVSEQKRQGVRGIGGDEL